ncbi:calcineurin binding protein-like protein [Lentithecium fluviatile CBS 122367]|uniref:Calcineurin binding protein-like protein n=1 Tax=Lentithecium fluviatile CBS 122367 TaxID=1168545 RepID=A0A6G1JFV4_9PLEO|nr:calcineurin binding protein-like protein [Lentithecium fluviatile CBS 122367]
MTAMATDIPSPQHSRTSSRTKSPLSLDLSDLPPLSQPSPPSNTLIITNLVEPEIFKPSNLVQIRETINRHGAIHTWAPLKSFRRIVVSFFDVDSAIAIRQKVDGEQIMGCRVRVYFGLNTPLNPSDQHLPLPKSDKLFFISPPPSPPMGWEMRNEEAPNAIVHAEDLAAALARLHADHHDYPSPTEASPMITRRRTGSSTIVYHPEDYGDSPNLPQIAVEDTTETPEPQSPADAMEGVEGPIAQHKAQGKNVSTARPPVELLN